VILWPALTMIAAWAIGGTPAIQCEAVEPWARDPIVLELHDPLAYTQLAERRAILSPLACGGAVLLAADPDGSFIARIGPSLGLDPRSVTMREAWGLFALLHESYHLRRAPAYAPSDEHAADCFALAKMPGVLELLHVPAGRRPELLMYAQSLHDREPPPYSGACS
jgi:hypothetical protein